MKKIISKLFGMFSAKQGPAVWAGPEATEALKAVARGTSSVIIGTSGGRRSVIESTLDPKDSGQRFICAPVRSGMSVGMLFNRPHL